MRTVVLGVIIKNGKILIGKKREGYHPMNLGGKWHVIGGKMEENETEEEAIRREVKEETGLEIEILERAGEKIIKNFEGISVKIVTFICKAREGEPTAGSDLVEVKWVGMSDFLKSICNESKLLLPENIELKLEKYQTS